jgi:TRAP-type C4-dicarboxylate transport system permease small subunit
MIYLKSAVSGILAVAATGVLLYTTLTLLLLIPVMLRNENQGFDLPRWHVDYASPVLWILVLVIFAAGFWWEFHRV